MSVDELVQEFATCVTAQSEAIAKGDYIAGNGFAARYASAFNQLREYGDQGRDSLAMLMTDTRREVRVMAATYLLRHCGEGAVAVLRAESMKGDLIGFGASQALARWQEGAWNLDPER